MKTLVILEHDKDGIKRSSLACLTAAIQLGHPIDALVMGSDAKLATEQASKLDSLQQVLWPANASDKAWLTTVFFSGNIASAMKINSKDKI